MLCGSIQGLGTRMLCGFPAQYRRRSQAGTNESRTAAARVSDEHLTFHRTKPIQRQSIGGGGAKCAADVMIGVLVS